MFGQSRIDAVTRLHAALRTYYIAFQGRTQEGADGAKAPPEIPRQKLFTHSISNPEHFMFRSLYKEVSFTIII